jgi:hypothetical protein
MHIYAIQKKIGKVTSMKYKIFIWLPFFGVGQGFELRASRRRYTTWATPPVHSAQVILETGSLELFAPAGLEPQSSQDQPGLQLWATSARFMAHNFILT